MIRKALLLSLLWIPTTVLAQTVTSPGPVTVVANDDGADADGTIEFRNGAVTRLFIDDDGNIYILKKIGINNSSPSASIHVKPTYPDGVTAGENVLEFTNPNGNSFGFNLSQTLQGGNANDDVMMWGWNVDANTPNEPTLRFSMERQFGANPSNFEFMLESVTPSGGQQRPWFWTINRNTGSAEVSTTAVSHFVRGATQFHIGDLETLSMGPFRQQSDRVVFETMANGGAPAKQIRMVPLPTDASQTAISFGGQAYLANNGTTLNVTGPVGTTGKLSAGRVSVGNVGLDTSLGVRVASGQSIRFAMGLDPFGAADATITRNGTNSLSVTNPDGNVPTTIHASFNAYTSNGGSYKVNNTKVVGAQCGAILNSNGTQTDTTRAVNAVLVCLRSHGLVAQ